MGIMYDASAMLKSGLELCSLYLVAISLNI